MAAVLSRQDGELACDEGALRGANDRERVAYGYTLVRLVTTRPSTGRLLRCATTVTAGLSSLKRRIAIVARRPRIPTVALAAIAFLVRLTTGYAFIGGRSGV